MANLSLKHIYKVYPNGTKAVNDFTMDIADKEFIVFVGPSGCGKSTTLRMIAGLEEISAGELKIGDVVMNDAEPKERDIAMVFQNYALYPHMTIYDNIAFGLKMRKVSKEEIDAKVKEAAETLGITEYLEKKPKEMSGGQRQRVALGRAIVREPKVMLLDEPLSNLDAKLRTQMRSEIIKLHDKLQTTFIYVTHDQVEAMTMGTRIVVMKDGFIQQIDAPKNLYLYPENKFVAGFIGTPQMNFLPATLKKAESGYVLALKDVEATLPLPERIARRITPKYLRQESSVTIGIRPENLSFVSSDSTCPLEMTVSHNEELGTETLTYCTLGDSLKVIVKGAAFASLKPGSKEVAYLDLDKMHLFDDESEESIIPRLPKSVFASCAIDENSIEIYGKRFHSVDLLGLEMGQAEAIIPLDAFVEGKDITGTILGVEEVEGKYLYDLDVKGERLFLLKDALVKTKTLKFSLDLTKVDFHIGERKIPHLDLTNSFDASFEMRKVKGIDQETGKKTRYNQYSFLFLDSSFDVEEGIAKRVFNAYRGRKAFNTAFTISFAPSSVKLGAEGLEGTVLKTFVYGAKEIALLQVGEKTLYAQIQEPLEVGQSVCLSFQMDEASLVEPERGIQIL